MLQLDEPKRTNRMKPILLSLSIGLSVIQTHAAIIQFELTGRAGRGLLAGNEPGVSNGGSGGVFVANPHVNYLEDAGRFRPDNIQLMAKQKYDPHGLLNPGKMISFKKSAVPA